MTKSKILRLVKSKSKIQEWIEVVETQNTKMGVIEGAREDVGGNSNKKRSHVGGGRGATCRRTGGLD